MPPVPEKRCENCRKVMKPRILPNGNPEPPSYLKKKRFCSRICAGVFIETAKKAERDAAVQA